MGFNIIGSNIQGSNIADGENIQQATQMSLDDVSTKVAAALESAPGADDSYRDAAKELKNPGTTKERKIQLLQWATALIPLASAWITAHYGG